MAPRVPADSPGCAQGRPPWAHVSPGPWKVRPGSHCNPGPAVFTFPAQPFFLQEAFLAFPSADPSVSELLYPILQATPLEQRKALQWPRFCKRPHIPSLNTHRWKTQQSSWPRGETDNPYFSSFLLPC